MALLFEVSAAIWVDEDVVIWGLVRPATAAVLRAAIWAVPNSSSPAVLMAPTWAELSAAMAAVVRLLRL